MQKQQQQNDECHPHPDHPFSNAENIEREGCDVSNGLDRGRADVVVDDVDKFSTLDVPASDHKQGQEINKTNNQKTTVTTTGTGTDNCNDSQKLGQARTQPCQDHNCTIGQHGSDETICCNK